MLKISFKFYDELSLEELYALLRLRAEVFVVEQECVYQDIDGKDQKALHLIGQYQREIVGYTRLFRSGDYFKQASIGRVVISKAYRGKGFGKLLIKESIKAIYQHFGKQLIKISAQKHLSSLYAEMGFVRQGDEYLEDGIPHIAMILKWKHWNILS